MLEKKIKYTDFRGTERTDVCYFMYTESELIKMGLDGENSLFLRMQRLVEARDDKDAMQEFEALVLGAYGEVSDDGRDFIKIDPVTKANVSDRFRQTAAYDELFRSLYYDPKATSDFVFQVLPKKFRDEIEKNRDQIDAKAREILGDASYVLE